MNVTQPKSQTTPVLPKAYALLIKQALSGSEEAIQSIALDAASEVPVSYQLLERNGFMRHTPTDWVKLLYESGHAVLVDKIFDAGLLKSTRNSFSSEDLVIKTFENRDWKNLSKCLSHVSEDANWKSYAWRTFAQRLLKTQHASEGKGIPSCLEVLNALGSADVALKELSQKLQSNPSKKKRALVEHLEVLPEVLVKLWQVQEEHGQLNFLFLKEHVQFANAPRLWVDTARAVASKSTENASRVWDSLVTHVAQTSCADEVKLLWARELESIERETLGKMGVNLSDGRGKKALDACPALATHERFPWLSEKVSSLEEQTLTAQKVAQIEIALILALHKKKKCGLTASGQKELWSRVERYKTKRLPDIDWNVIWQAEIQLGRIEERDVINWRIAPTFKKNAQWTPAL